MRRIKFIFIFMLFFGSILISCQFQVTGGAGNTGKTESGERISVDDESATDASGTNFNSNSSIYITLNDDLTSCRDDNSVDQIVTTKKTELMNGSVKVKFTQDDNDVSTGVVRIDLENVTENVAVYVSGKLTTGGLKIQTNPSYEVGLYLNSVEISSSNYPCVDITKGGAASVFLSGTNVFSDGRTYGIGYGEEYSETEGDTYTDDGTEYSCTVTKSAVKEGSDSKGTLYCKGGLAVCGDGSLKITTAYKHCIASKNVLRIVGGTYDCISTGKSGFFGDMGVEVSGGNLKYNGTGSVGSSGSGYYNNRKANGINVDDETYGDAVILVTGGIMDFTCNYGKGITAPVVKIAGGTITISTSGSYGSDSGGMGWGSSSSSSYSYYDADGVLQKGSIKCAPEGIEGESAITISGGNVIINAADDGINVSNTGGNLIISGGFVYVSSSGDGLDSNGNITISDGVTVVSQTGGGNSPIDCGDGSYKFTVTGTNATVFAMGSSDMFSESIPSSTVNAMIYKTSGFSGSSSLGVNGIIGLKNPQSYGAAILISSSLTSGSSYSFVSGGSITGTELFESGVYFPATISGGSSSSVTATKSSSSGSGSFGPGSTPWH